MEQIIKNLKAIEDKHQQEMKFIKEEKFTPEYFKKSTCRWKNGYEMRLSEFGDACRKKWEAFNEEMKQFDTLIVDMKDFDKNDIVKRDKKFHRRVKQDGWLMGNCRMCGNGKGISFPEHIWEAIKGWAVEDYAVPKRMGHRSFKIGKIYKFTDYDLGTPTTWKYRFDGLTPSGQGRFAKHMGGFTFADPKRVRLRTTKYKNKYPKQMKRFNMALYGSGDIDRMDFQELIRYFTATLFGAERWCSEESLRRKYGPNNGKWERSDELVNRLKYRNPPVSYRKDQYWEYMDYELARDWFYVNITKMWKRLCDNFKCLHKKRNIDKIINMIPPEGLLDVFERLFFNRIDREDVANAEGKTICRVPVYDRGDNIGDEDFDAREDYIKRHTTEYSNHTYGGWCYENKETIMEFLRVVKEAMAMITSRTRKYRGSRFYCQQIVLSDNERSKVNEYFNQNEILSADVSIIGNGM